MLLTCGFTFQSIVSPSAYPGHYPRRSLLRPSHPFSSLRLTPALKIDHFGELEVVTPFLMFVFRSGRAVLSTGFGEGEYESAQKLLASILSHFGQANNPRRLVRTNDGSDVRLLALPVATCCQSLAGWIPAVSGFIPASKIEDRSLLWGICVSLFTSMVGNFVLRRTSSCHAGDLAPVCSPSLSCSLISGKRIAVCAVHHTAAKTRSVSRRESAASSPLWPAAHACHPDRL